MQRRQLESRTPAATRSNELRYRIPSFAGFVDIANGGFINQQVGSTCPGQLNTVLVIPFDQSLYLVTIFQDHDHGSLALNLLLVIKVFSVGLVSRTGPSNRWHAVGALQAFTTLRNRFGPLRRSAQRRPDQLTADKFFVSRLGGLTCGCGFHSIFHFLYAPSPAIESRADAG